MMLPDRFRGFTAACVLLLAWVPTARAQAGKEYVNEKQGFSFKPPKDWTAVPPQPGEEYVLVKYAAKNKQMTKKGDRVSFNPETEVAAFNSAAVTTDPEPGDDSPEGPKRRRGRETYSSFATWYEENYNDPKKNGEPKALVINKIPVVAWDFTLTHSNAATRLRAYVFSRKDGEVALIFSSLVDSFDGIEKEFEASARSFKWIEKAAAGGAAASTGATDAFVGLDDETKTFLQEQIKQLPPGWSSLVSGKKRYLFLYDADEKFVKRLDRHLEAMRDYYETLFKPDHPLTAVSIVRVCKDRDTYLGYGAPPSSGGYWSDRAHELVIYHNKAEDQNETFVVISHEAFHQYIFYFYGELDPHSWYNEGHGDYFGGVVMDASGGRVQKIAPLDATSYPRLSTIRELVRKDASVPLKAFMQWSQREYYAGDGLGHYAQGWSIVYFLRNGRKEGGKVDDKWSKMLGEYLANLVAARDQIHQDADGGRVFGLDEQAQKKAFATTFQSWTDDDWSAFEAAWKKFYGG